MFDIYWILKYKILQRRKWGYIKGYTWKDGYKWYTRGVKDVWISYMEHEEWLNLLFHSMKGRLFIDIGSHVGRWSIRSSKNFEQIISIEPHPDNCKILMKNIRFNKIKNIKILNVGLSDKIGEERLTEYSAGTGASSMLGDAHPMDWWSGNKFQWGHKNIKSNLIVKVTTLDSLRLKPDFIKIDTEGFEMPILKGGFETIRKYHPILLVEVHLKNDLYDIPLLLKELGYNNIEVINHPMEIQILAKYIV